MDGSYQRLPLVSHFILHRRRHHVDLPDGDRLKSVLRHLQQAMAIESEKEEGPRTADIAFRFSTCALLRRDRQLSVLQRGHHGQRRRRDQAVGSGAALSHFAHMDGSQGGFHVVASPSSNSLKRKVQTNSNVPFVRFQQASLEATWNQARHQGFWATWAQLVDLTDPRGEINAYKVRTSSRYLEITQR